MSTRLKRPSLIKQALIACLLLGFQIYLGHSALNGQFGLHGQDQLKLEIAQLEAEKARLAIQVRDLKHRISLFDPSKLDPDVLTELARAHLALANENDILVHVN